MPNTLRDLHGQLVVDSGSGDCLRAAMSYVLGVPNGDYMPNPHKESEWYFEWQRFFEPLGISIMYSHSRGPIWKEHCWIASVISKNITGCTHAIVMRGTQVEFDPSPKRRYRRMAHLLGKEIVIGGHWLEVADATKLPNLVKWIDQHK